MQDPEYTIVVPVYRAERTIDELCERIRNIFDDILRVSFEVILVDDASPDGSWAKLCELHGQDSRFKIIQLARNFGQHNALMCGFKYAAGEYVITMDDDLQHPPEEIPKLIEAMRQHPDADMVIGAYSSKQHSLMRNLGSYVSRWFGHRIFRQNRRLRYSSFRLVRGLTVKSILQVKIERPRVGQLLLQMSNRVVNTPVNHDPRKYGRSGYAYGRLIKDLIYNIIYNSSLPLQWISYLGLASAVLSFMLAGYYLYRYFFVGITVPGWTTMILLLLFYFGILLLAVGIIGEYLARIIKENRRMPQYVIRDLRR